jgi:uncharacterized protein (TIGR03086 family)
MRMLTIEELRGLHAGALADCGELVDRAARADLRLPTPCGDWDLAALLAHMIGQNAGFALAVERGDADESAYEPPPIAPRTLPATWAASADRVRAAFARADPDAQVNLSELGRKVTVAQALRMQLLDSAVHAWDVATALGLAYQPSAETAALVLGSAREIAARPGGVPGVFAAPRAEAGRDPWSDALRLLGRDPRDSRDPGQPAPAGI